MRQYGSNSWEEIRIQCFAIILWIHDFVLVIKSHHFLHIKKLDLCRLETCGIFFIENKMLAYRTILWANFDFTSISFSCSRINWTLSFDNKGRSQFLERKLVFSFLSKMKFIRPWCKQTFWTCFGLFRYSSANFLQCFHGCFYIYRKLWQASELT